VKIHLRDELGAMEERKKSSGSFFNEFERWRERARGLLPLGNLYPSGPNGTLSAALPHPPKQLC
jgi:hypothetical protein